MSEFQKRKSYNETARSRELSGAQALAGRSSAISGLNESPAYTLSPNHFQERGEAKNIIFMVSDGMSSGTLNMADLLNFQQNGRRSHWINLYASGRNVYRGLMDMASLNSPVTDSAAASSSWGSGYRVYNGAINTGPNREQYQPINQIFKDAGRKTGLVTTARITHATPAGFSVNMANRNDEDQIAEQYLQREYDILLGGGARHFEAGTRHDSRDLIEEFSDKKYTIVRNKRQLLEAPIGDRLLGLFGNCHLPYTIDRKTIDSHQRNIPSLADMTARALQLLENEHGFILQVEGGRIDHGAHDNDAPAMIYEQLAFDSAVEEVLNFVDQRDDTLLIITTDHGNGNPSLNGAGPQYGDTNCRLDQLQHFRHSNTWILSELDARSSISQIRASIHYATELEISINEAELLHEALNNNLCTPYAIQNSPADVLGAIMANYISINFTSGNHTGEYVELAALGPGTRNLNHFTHNTMLFYLMIYAAGIEKYHRCSTSYLLH